MNKVGVAIIGASHRSTMLFEFFKKFPSQGFITGIYDRVHSRSKYLLDKYALDAPKVYESLDQALADPETQAVFIGTTDCEHVNPSVAALNAGKHVYCEKPLDISLEACDEIIEAAKASEAVFYLGMNLRHSPVHETVYNIIQSGDVGKVLTIEANEWYIGGRTYFRRWNRLRQFGGGLWITKATHDFDILNWLAGAKPTRIYATSSLSYYKAKPEGATHCRICPIKMTCPDFYDIECPVNPTQDDMLKLTEEVTGDPRDMCLYNSDKDTFDNGIAVVDYGNDIRATYTVNVVSARSTRQIRVLGTLGCIEADMEYGKVVVHKRYDKHKIEHDLIEKMKSGHGGADDNILLDFLRCARTSAKPRSSWADGRISVKLGLAARESCDTGKAIDLTN